MYFFIIGACLTSFLQVVVERSTTPGSLPFYKGRSHCDACGATLTAGELVPVFGWLFLRGRCRHCRAKVSPRYPITEAVGGVCCGLLALAFAASPLQLLVGVIFWALLMLIALYDAKTMEIPDLYTLLLCLPAIAAVWVFPQGSIWAHVIGAVCISLPLLLIALLLPGAFGAGDIQLMFVCGFFLGWKNCLVAFFLALLVAGAQAVFLFASGRAKFGQGAHMPFGPALCAGCFLSLLYGQALLNWYLGFFVF